MKQLAYFLCGILTAAIASHAHAPATAAPKPIVHHAAATPRPTVRIHPNETLAYQSYALLACRKRGYDFVGTSNVYEVGSQTYIDCGRYISPHQTIEIVRIPVDRTRLAAGY